jgi:hypothetical protein
MDQHTNHACPEPSARPSEKTNTSISTVPYLDKPPAKPRRHRDLHNEVYVFDLYDLLDRFHTDENAATVMKVGRVAIITRGRYAGKKVRQSDSFSLPPAPRYWKKEREYRNIRGGIFYCTESTRDLEERNVQMAMGKYRELGIKLADQCICLDSGRHCPAQRLWLQGAPLPLRHRRRYRALPPEGHPPHG